METTRTILRRFKDDGSVIAIFLDIDEGRGMVSSYMRVGQHGAASRDVVSVTRPCRVDDEDAAALLRELERVGYSPRVIQRWPSR